MTNDEGMDRNEVKRLILISILCFLFAVVLVFSYVFGAMHACEGRLTSGLRCINITQKCETDTGQVRDMTYDWPLCRYDDIHEEWICI